MEKRKLPRGLRNNNPLNIKSFKEKWQGQVGDDGTFCIFQSLMWAFRAVFKLLMHYNRLHRYTVRSIIERWAPATENDTNAYVESVCRNTGFEPTTIIDVANTEDEYEAKQLVLAMASVELGMDFEKVKELFKDDIYAGYELAVG